MLTKQIHLGLVAAAAGLMFAGVNVAHAAVVYSDTFARTGALDGSAPTSSTPPATWAAGSTFTTTLAPPAAVVTANPGTAILPLTVTPGSIATASVTMTPTGGDDNWLALSFLDDLTGVSLNSADFNSAEGFVLYRGSGGTQYFVGHGPAAGVSGGTALKAGTPDTFTITLDDTNQAAPTISFTDSLGLLGLGALNQAYNGTVSSIQNVGLIDIGETGSFSTFSASSPAVSAVPEPATLGVLALGGVGLLARRRKA